jgi:heptosyltransferase I
VNARQLARRCPHPKSVLITRLSAIGDCVATLPLAVEVKKLWPECQLTWVVDCAAEQLLRDHPCIDHVIRIEKRWLTKPSCWTSIRERFRNQPIDLVLDPQGLTKSSLLGWLSGARYRVGFDYSHARELSPLMAHCRVRRTHRHMVDAYRELLVPWMDVETRTGEFRMPIYADQSAAVEAQLGAWQLLPDSQPVSQTCQGPWKALAPSNKYDGLPSPSLRTHSKYDGLPSPSLRACPGTWIALNPGAGWPTKLWPRERFAKLARYLSERYHLPSIVFWAGEHERLMANEICEQSEGAARMAPSTNLRELAEYLRRATILVTSDTGPMHIASAVQTPTISMHGPTWGDECGPYGKKHLTIQSPLPRLSEKVERHGPNHAMQVIGLEEVQLACDRMLRGQLAILDPGGAHASLEAA